MSAVVVDVDGALRSAKPAPQEEALSSDLHSSSQTRATQDHGSDDENDYLTKSKFPFFVEKRILPSDQDLKYVACCRLDLQQPIPGPSVTLLVFQPDCFCLIPQV